MLLSYTADERDTGRTISSVLRGEFNISSSLVRRLKHTEAIKVCGEPVYVNYMLTVGETVSVEVTAGEPECDNMPEHGEIEIMYENEGLLAVNKAAGLLVHPSRSRNTGTLSNYVAGYLAKTGNSRCHAVNRLDRDTGGVVLFAKNGYMKARACKALSRPETVREYIAAVLGVPPERGEVNAPIRRFKAQDMLRIVAQDGQRAVTHFEREQVKKTHAGEISLMRLRLETGRTHQIRVHMLHIGHPVLGDSLYAVQESERVSEILGIKTQALHAQRLCFTEPLSSEYLNLSTGFLWNGEIFGRPDKGRKKPLYK